MIIELLFNLLYLDSLVPEFHKLVSLLLIIFLYEFIEVPDLLVQVSVDVLQFGVGHLQHRLPLGVKNLDFFLAEIKLFSCLINFLLKNKIVKVK